MEGIVLHTLRAMLSFGRTAKRRTHAFHSSLLPCDSDHWVGWAHLHILLVAWGDLLSSHCIATATVRPCFDAAAGLGQLGWKPA